MVHPSLASTAFSRPVTCPACNGPLTFGWPKSNSIPAWNGPRWELLKYFDEYREDYNTATLPHVKYYDYDRWELEEYQKKQQAASTAAAPGSILADAVDHEQRRQEQRRREQQTADAVLLASMDRDKISDMKRQKDLRAQMQLAYKTGDMETYEHIKQKLGPGG